MAGWSGAWVCVGVGGGGVSEVVGDVEVAVGVELERPAWSVDEVMVAIALCRVRDYAGLVGSCLVSAGGCVIFPGIVRGV